VKTIDNANTLRRNLSRRLRDWHHVRSNGCTDTCDGLVQKLTKVLDENGSMG